MKRNVIITGGSKGIGKAMVSAFLDQGDTVVFTARGEKDAQKVLDEKAKEVQEGRLYFFQCDVAKEEDIKKLVAFTTEKVGTCQVLINNAAIFHCGLVHEVGVDSFDDQFAINVRGTFLMCKYYIPQMLENKKGNIINIASIAGLNGGYNMAIYGASKAAVINMTRSMAMDYTRYGIRINGVCPSATLTDMFLGGNTEEVIEMYKNNNPSRRLGKPEEIADAAVYLASDQSSYISGQLLSVDGGLASWNGEACQPTR